MAWFVWLFVFGAMLIAALRIFSSAEPQEQG
jgi:hypothetical protein